MCHMETGITRLQQWPPQLPLGPGHSPAPGAHGWQSRATDDIQDQRESGTSMGK